MKEVTQRVCALRLGTTLVMRVTLSSSSLPLFPSRLFTLSDTTGVNGVWTRPEGEEKGEEEGGKMKWE